MSAPKLGEDWMAQLTALKPGWNSYDGKPICQSAIDTLKNFHVVPTSCGGIQLEVHQDGFDIEIYIEGPGRISSVFVGKEKGR